MVRFGASSTPKASSPDRRVAKLIGYLTKYLAKNVADATRDHEAQRDHVDRLAEALRYEPCSPTCANWLRYGVQPKNPRKRPRPRPCKGKAHRREYLGYGGRRVLVSRKWSGKTLADHKADRKAWVLARLAEAGIPVNNPADPQAAYVWERAGPGDPDVKPAEQRLLLLINERIQRRQSNSTKRPHPTFRQLGRQRDHRDQGRRSGATSSEARTRGDATQHRPNQGLRTDAIGRTPLGALRRQSQSSGNGAPRLRCRPSRNRTRHEQATRQRRRLIYKDGDRWRGAISLGYSEDGRRIRKKPGRTRAEVVRKLRTPGSR